VIECRADVHRNWHAGDRNDLATDGRWVLAITVLGSGIAALDARQPGYHEELSAARAGTR